MTIVSEAMPRPAAAEARAATVRRFALIINLKVAKELGVYPPIAMLNYAEVIA